MDSQHLEKLRRFALLAGLALLTYVAAGVAVDPKLAAFGVSFTIARPEWLPVALVVSSSWGTIRYWYYGMMLGASPYRVRRDAIDALFVESPNPPLGATPKGATVWMYFGPRTFRSSPWTPSRQDQARNADTLTRMFPKFLRARVTAKVVRREGYDDEGREVAYYAIEVTIPKRCRVGAAVEDFDYALPVTLNAVALGWFAIHWLG